MCTNSKNAGRKRKKIYEKWKWRRGRRKEDIGGKRSRRKEAIKSRKKKEGIKEQ